MFQLIFDDLVSNPINNEEISFWFALGEQTAPHKLKCCSYPVIKVQ